MCNSLPSQTSDYSSVVENPVHTYRTTYVLRPWTDKQQEHIEDQKRWFVENRKKLRQDQRVFYAEF